MRLRTDGLTWQEIDGELIILDLARSAYLTTNETGTFLAQQLMDGATREELVSALQDRYRIDEARARADVDGFIVELTERQLLV